MTAMAVHPKVPIVATGSLAQFIKLFTLDNFMVQVIKTYEEMMAGHRIGPVGCLAFHPHKLLLASGGTDAFVSIYSPKKAAF
jgi:regulator-associated protein of mTOR